MRKKHHSKEDVFAELNERSSQLLDLANLQVLCCVPEVFDYFRKSIEAKLATMDDSSEEFGELEMEKAVDDLYEDIKQLNNGNRLFEITRAMAKDELSEDLELHPEEIVLAELAVLEIAAKTTYQNRAGLEYANAYASILSLKVDKARSISTELRLLILYKRASQLSEKMGDFNDLFEKAAGKKRMEDNLKNLDNFKLSKTEIAEAIKLKEALIKEKSLRHVKSAGNPNKSAIAKTIQSRLNLPVSVKTIQRYIF